LKTEGLPNGRICEVSFGYNSKMEGYTTPMSGIAELGEIVSKGVNKTLKMYISKKYTNTSSKPSEKRLVRNLLRQERCDSYEREKRPNSRN